MKVAEFAILQKSLEEGLFLYNMPENFLSKFLKEDNYITRFINGILLCRLPHPK